MGIDMPSKFRSLIIGVGVHCLSSGRHLAKDLKAGGRGSCEDVIVIDKTNIAPVPAASPAA